MLTVYLAGGMCPRWRASLSTTLHALTHSHKLGDRYRLLTPTDLVASLPTPRHYATWDRMAICNSDIIFAYMARDNPSGYGLAAEIGYASALGKTIILADERSPVDPAFAPYYAFIHQFATYHYDTVAAALARLVDLMRLGV